MLIVPLISELVEREFKESLKTTPLTAPSYLLEQAKNEIKSKYLPFI